MICSFHSDLYNNQLSGTLPTEWGLLTKLTVLWVPFCHFVIISSTMSMKWNLSVYQTFFYLDKWLPIFYPGLCHLSGLAWKNLSPCMLFFFSLLHWIKLTLFFLSLCEIGLWSTINSPAPCLHNGPHCQISKPCKLVVLLLAFHQFISDFPVPSFAGTWPITICLARTLRSGRSWPSWPLWFWVSTILLAPCRPSGPPSPTFLHCKNKPF